MLQAEAPLSTKAQNLRCPHGVSSLQAGCGADREQREGSGEDVSQGWGRTARSLPEAWAGLCRQPRATDRHSAGERHYRTGLFQGHSEDWGKDGLQGPCPLGKTWGGGLGGEGAGPDPPHFLQGGGGSHSNKAILVEGGGWSRLCGHTEPEDSMGPRDGGDQCSAGCDH